MNIWLGPLERQYVHALQDFAFALDKDVRVAPVAVAPHNTIRGYGLASATRAGIYLHHFQNHSETIANATVTIAVPKAANAYWYSPEDGRILSRRDAPAGHQTFAVPPFTVDIALLIVPGSPPDSDHDGKSNDIDVDDDNDGVPDLKDAYPLDREDWVDQDHDLIGDNLDADVAGCDRNHNGVPDCAEPDFDGDGIPKAEAVPWDAFPLDPKEWRDTDGDGIGHNADRDDDGDGWTDVEEEAAGTDPLDRLSFPSK